MTIALYPGSFDPVTYGHLDIAKRAAALFDEVVMAVYATPENKQVLFNTEERLKLLAEATKDCPNIRAVSYTGLTVDVAHQVRAKVMIRGLRMVSDFEREFEMALMNKRLAPDIELVTLMSNLEYQFLSSSLLKEVVKLGKNANCFVPPNVAAALVEKFRGSEG